MNTADLPQHPLPETLHKIGLTSASGDADFSSVLSDWTVLSVPADTLRGSLHLGVIRSLALYANSFLTILRAELVFRGLHSLTIDDKATLRPDGAINGTFNSKAPALQALPLQAPSLRELTFNLSAAHPIFRSRQAGATASRLAEFIGSRVQSAREGNLRLDKVTIAQQE